MRLTKLVIINSGGLILGLLPSLISLLAVESISSTTSSTFFSFLALQICSITQILAFHPPDKTHGTSSPMNTTRGKTQVERGSINLSISKGAAASIEIHHTTNVPNEAAPNSSSSDV